MRIIESRRGYFNGTHKGHEIEITREPDGSFYIRVWSIASGMHAYDGWADEEIRTMPQAKREALQGSGLSKPEAQPAGGEG